VKKVRQRFGDCNHEMDLVAMARDCFDLEDSCPVSASLLGRYKATNFSWHISQPFDISRISKFLSISMHGYCVRAHDAAYRNSKW
jgi:hypothetical protein